MIASNEIIQCKFEWRNFFPRRILKRQSYLQKIFIRVFLAFYIGCMIFILATSNTSQGLLITAAVVLGIYLIKEVSSITATFALTPIGIEYQSNFGSKIQKISYDEIRHFCFYETPVERYGYSNNLIIYLKPLKFGYERASSIRLNFSAEENMTILSILHRAGFKVLLFDLLLNIEETEFYIPKKEL